MIYYPSDVVDLTSTVSEYVYIFCIVRDIRIRTACRKIWINIYVLLDCVVQQMILLVCNNLLLFRVSLILVRCVILNVSAYVWRSVNTVSQMMCCMFVLCRVADRYACANSIDLFVLNVVRCMCIFGCSSSRDAFYYVRRCPAIWSDLIWSHV